MYKKSRLVRNAVLLPALIMSMSLTACTTPTGSSGSMLYFTEGKILEAEVIDLKKNKNDTMTNTGIMAAGGAVAGQIIGGDTKGTLIGAGIGAAIGLLGSHVLDSGTGLRLTVQTDSGTVLIDQPYSCDLKPGSKIRIITQKDGNLQVQVNKNGRYVTATASDSNVKCDFL